MKQHELERFQRTLRLNVLSERIALVALLASIAVIAVPAVTMIHGTYAKLATALTIAATPHR